MGVRVCAVSFKDVRGIHHRVDVEADSVYEAVVTGVSFCHTDAAMVARLSPSETRVTLRETDTKV